MLQNEISFHWIGLMLICFQEGGLFQHKVSLSRNWDFHYRDKMVMRPSYLSNQNPYIGNTVFYIQTRPRFSNNRVHFTSPMYGATSKMWMWLKDLSSYFYEWKKSLKNKWTKRALVIPAHKPVLYAMDIQWVQTLHGKHVTMIKH